MPLLQGGSADMICVIASLHHGRQNGVDVRFHLVKKLAILVVLALAAGPVRGQSGWVNPHTGGLWNNPGSCLLDTMIRNRMNQQMLERSIGRQAETTAPQAPRGQRLTYRPVEHLGNAQEMSASLTDSPEDRQNLTGFFLEALEKYRVASAQVGRANDVGYALAFCLGCCYGAFNGCDVPDDTLMALAAQMDQALADMPGFAQASDSQRQTVAESAVMVGMFVAAGYEQSSDDAEAREAFVDLAKSSFRSLTGLDPESVRLTSSGLRIR